MKRILTLLLLFLAIKANSQITSGTAVGVSTTSYSNGAPNDSIFYYCSGQLGELTATPPSGVPGWTFIWQEFDLATNSWIALSTVTGVPTSTISNLQPDGYRVTIVDGTGAVVGCYIAWVVQILTPATVDVLPIPPSCTTALLQGVIDWGTCTPVYNPPPDPLLINASTQITVCFSGTHTWVSDLSFYLVGPAACGSQTVLLSQYPGAYGGGNCNSGDDISNLCFQTGSAANLNICGAPTPLSGTYGSWGPGSTPINWTPLFGCDATQPGWRVQIYDCVGLDVGVLQNATITMTGTSICGNPTTVTYNSGAINSVINDNSCTPGSASIFTVPVTPATIMPLDTSFIWTANPAFTIPGNTSQLTINLTPAPGVPTLFTLSLTGNGSSAANSACGGNNQDTELFTPLFPTPAALGGNTSPCLGDAPYALTTSVPGGIWSGPGITDPVNGIFDPTVAGAGTVMVSYSLTTPCPVTTTLSITVTSSADATITNPGTLCTSSGNVILTAASIGGIWSGTGIINGSTGEFDPALSGAGSFLITYTISGSCSGTDTTIITVTAPPTVNINAAGPYCLNAGSVNLTADVLGGTWSGNGITDPSNGTFDPATAGVGIHTITYVTSGSCPGTATATITVNDLPNVNAGTDASVCPGDTTTLNATGALNYVWTPTTGLSSSTIANPDAFPVSTTTYTVTGTDINNCSASDDVTVNVYAQPVVTVTSPVNVCEGDSTQLSASGLTNYSWTPSSDLSASNISNPYASPTTNTTYTVSGTDANGCFASATVAVNVISPNASFTSTPTEGLLPLDVVFTDNSTGTSFSWDFGNGFSSTTSGNQQTTYLTEGTYTVILVVTLNGCTDTATTTILVYDMSLLVVPNVISANGDGINDDFMVEQEGITELRIDIFNRWGQHIGEITTPTGRWSGADQSEGTYYYVLTAKGVDKKDYLLNGFFTLTR